jgi:hypothetical protein
LAKKLGTYSKPLQMKVQQTSNLLKEKVKHGNKKNKKTRELQTFIKKNRRFKPEDGM